MVARKKSSTWYTKNPDNNFFSRARNPLLCGLFAAGNDLFLIEKKNLCSFCFYINLVGSKWFFLMGIFFGGEVGNRCCHHSTAHITHHITYTTTAPGGVIWVVAPSRLFHEIGFQSSRYFGGRCFSSLFRTEVSTYSRGSHFLTLSTCTQKWKKLLAKAYLFLESIRILLAVSYHCSPIKIFVITTLNHSLFIKGLASFWEPPDIKIQYIISIHSYLFYVYTSAYFQHSWKPVKMV